MTPIFKFKHLVCLLSPTLLFPALLPGGVSSEQTDSAVTLYQSGKPVLTYHTAVVRPPAGMEAHYARSGFIHPLYSPAGKVLTDAFPIGHAHQHGVFNAWTQTTVRHEVVDFWNQAKGSGNVKHVELGDVEDGSFEADLQQYSLKRGAAINEEWEVAVHDQGDPFLIDIEIEQKCATANEVYLHPYHYGGFGLRGSAHWSSEDEPRFEGLMKILTGEGVTDIAASNHTRPGWVAVYGKIDGKEAGFVVMDHPSNFRYPQPVRVHPKMPYFVFSPVVEGSFIIRPGFTYESRYRIATFDGPPDPETIEAWYEDFTGKR